MDFHDTETQFVYLNIFHSRLEAIKLFRENFSGTITYNTLLTTYGIKFQSEMVQHIGSI